MPSLEARKFGQTYVCGSGRTNIITQQIPALVNVVPNDDFILESGMHFKFGDCTRCNTTQGIDRDAREYKLVRKGQRARANRL